MNRKYNRLFIKKEGWVNAAEAIQKAAPVICELLEKEDCENQEGQDREVFLFHMRMAHAALLYVSEFAADKCVLNVNKKG